MRSPQRRDQSRAERIARRLAGDNENRAASPAASRARHTDHEQAGAVGSGGNLVAVEDDCRPGLDGNPAQSGRGAERHGPRTDRRPIGAPFLTRLFDLDEHAARTFAAQSGAAPQQRVGALDRLDAKDEALLNDDRLTDVERAERPGDAQPLLDIGDRLRVGPGSAERTLGREPRRRAADPRR